MKAGVEATLLGTTWLVQIRSGREVSKTLGQAMELPWMLRHQGSPAHLFPHTETPNMPQTLPEAGIAEQCSL